MESRGDEGYDQKRISLKRRNKGEPYCNKEKIMAPATDTSASIGIQFTAAGDAPQTPANTTASQMIALAKESNLTLAQATQLGLKKVSGSAVQTELQKKDNKIFWKLRSRLRMVLNESMSTAMTDRILCSLPPRMENKLS
jgi:hypothetical protein